ncbi:tol-pal system YbgF family protein [Dechloromonas sp. HYN0024]|uniref:tetratricopeptide repeat protein n=1 Tax=Dechloromonas sp. HYN0024 TaxID=2231055 RepID=UPI0013C2E152|nr:hypothetical protein [Dechloromonas sp. HYN0024]
MAALLFGANAFANILDSIDIARADEKHAQITIHFGPEIQYVRHVPDAEGKFLRIFFRVRNPGFSESEVMQEVLRSPKSDLVPKFTVAYPELVNGMLITFAKSTTFKVRPGDDNHSIEILVPALIEAKAPPAPVVLPVAEPAKAVPAVAEAAPKEKVVAVSPATNKKKDKEKAKAALPTVAVAPLVVAAVTAESPATPVTQIPDASKPDEAPVMTAEKVEATAQAFLADGRDAFEKADYPKAINRMNRILSLPGNAQTQAAQALLGEAREKNGENTKAKAEYELFLKLYPTSSDAPRIKQRLAALPVTDTVKRVARVRDEKPAEWVVTGSLSSYFFTGQSQQDSGPMKKDQESLISSINLNARLRNSVTDTRIVFRDADSRNFMQPSRDYNRIYAAYAERTDREVGYFVRAGRQNPNGSGVMDRFDGITGSYNLNPDFKVSAVYGDAVIFNAPFKKTFYGGSVEFAAQLARPGASLYAIEEKLDGLLNRRAIGSEFRYFDGALNGYGMLDYDLLYKGMNIGMGQLNYMDKSGNNYFVSYDYRKSPSYSLLNALPSSGYSNANDLVANVGMTQSRQLVSDTTSASSMFAAGVTVPVGERWQFGFDYRMSEITGTNATIPLAQMCKEIQDGANPTDPLCVEGPRGTMRISEMGLCVTDSYDMITKTCRASSDASGRTNMYSAQAIATNLFVPNGIGVAYLGYISGPNYTGQNLGLSYIYPFIENWRLENNIRYYSQHSDSGQNSTQFSPSVKLVHQWRPDLSIEGELGYSDSKNTGTTTSSNKREYLYLGIRWDYR